MSADEAGADRRQIIGFWTWLIKVDRDGDRGLSNIINKSLIVHIAVGLIFSTLIKAHPQAIAKSVALPGSGILIGLAFGWAGRSSSLLQDKSFAKFVLNHGASPEGYVYSFQLAILSVLIFISVSILIIMGGFGVGFCNENLNNYIDRFLIFTLGSISIRESWGIIYFVNKMTLMFYEVKKVEFEREDG